jgi:SAM-dependent methyltransferase
MGRLLLTQEQALIDEQLRNLFGYHLLQLSITNQIDLTCGSRISHKFALYPHLNTSPAPTSQPSNPRTPDLQAIKSGPNNEQQNCTPVSALADFNHLPLPPNSIDVVLLHHLLDYSQSPHHVLREVSGVLIPRGHLLVVGFNPWSLFGLWRWVMRCFQKAPQWRHQSLRLGRVLDWLAVLDFEPVAIEQGFYCPPLQHTKALKYLHWMERWGKRLCLPWGGFYLIVARKDTVALTPLKPEWQGYAGLRGWGVIKILGRASRHTPTQAPKQAHQHTGDS